MLLYFAFGAEELRTARGRPPGRVKEDRLDIRGAARSERPAATRANAARGMASLLRPHIRVHYYTPCNIRHRHDQYHYHYVYTVIMTAACPVDPPGPVLPASLHATCSRQLANGLRAACRR